MTEVWVRLKDARKSVGNARGFTISGLNAVRIKEEMNTRVDKNAFYTYGSLAEALADARPQEFLKSLRAPANETVIGAAEKAEPQPDAPLIAHENVKETPAPSSVMSVEKKKEPEKGQPYAEKHLLKLNKKQQEDIIRSLDPKAKVPMTERNRIKLILQLQGG